MGNVFKFSKVYYTRTCTSKYVQVHDVYSVWRIGHVVCNSTVDTRVISSEKYPDL